MIFQLDVVNPKTNEERTITIVAEPVPQGACQFEFVQTRAREQEEIPAGFMPIGGRVREVRLC
ncbi:hypothetical protein [Bradyrhizobium sp.]|jgi:hypothetical protein|uniref:hypothetical protein n=1 Tax=Bradyrhizobium sp. TaxID=376 RepID=UPI002DDD4777|nr:hypothetical protein [Bradyrhizobium sp.]HEV2156356.1 hypothetical protein [Bradyrhizobium sp.]